MRGINSSILTSDDTSPFLLERKVARLLATGNSAKLFGHQEALLNRLTHVLRLQCQKFSGVEKGTAEAISKTGPSVVPSDTHLGVLNVAAATQMSSGKSTLGKCRELVDKRPLDVGLALTAVQLAVREASLSAASSITQTLLDALERVNGPESRKLRYAPGLVALSVALNRAQGKTGPAMTELSEVAAHASDPRGALSQSLLRQTGLELIKSHKINEVRLASTAFRSVLSRSPDDDLAAAGLVASSGMLGDAAAALSGKLSPVEDLVTGIDVEALLGCGVVGSSSATQLKRKSADEPQRPAKKRRRRVPKDVESGNEPDPERWLPLMDRSSYKPKGKKGKKKAAESTQGGVVKEETIELVGGAGAVKVEKTASASSRKKKKGRK